MIPIQVLVLPYVVNGLITPEQGDKVQKLVHNRLYGTVADQSVSYLNFIVQQCINEEMRSR